jgi:hypothetical protein
VKQTVGSTDTPPKQCGGAPHAPFRPIPWPCTRKNANRLKNARRNECEGLGERLSGGWEERASVPSAVTTGSCMGISVMGHRKSLKSGAAIVPEDTRTRSAWQGTQHRHFFCQHHEVYNFPSTFGDNIRIYPNDRNSDFFGGSIASMHTSASEGKTRFLQRAPRSKSSSRRTSLHALKQLNQCSLSVSSSLLQLYHKQWCTSFFMR